MERRKKLKKGTRVKKKKISVSSSSSTINFVGVGINSDACKLVGDHGIRVGGRRCGLAELAASRLERKKVRQQGLAREILGMNMLKPKKITLSNWSARYLSEEQIDYAFIDAYVSFSVGMKLLGRWR